jgi:hypothetical protein
MGICGQAAAMAVGVPIGAAEAASEIRLHKCVWHRVYCRKCGEFNAALAASQNGFTTCTACGGKCLITSTRAGKSMHALPWYERRVLKRWGVGGGPPLGGEFFLN